MKIALALLALSGLANAQRIPLVDEVIREVSDEIIYDDAPMRRTLKHVDDSIQSPLVEEVIRRGSEEIIYGNVVDAAKEADVSVNGNGMHRGLDDSSITDLAPDGHDLLDGHADATYAGVPKKTNSTQFKEASTSHRDRRRAAFAVLAGESNPNEEVRVLVGHTDASGRALLESSSQYVGEYIEGINVASALMTWGQVNALLTTGVGIE
jgi:hypothetical protein